MTGRSYDDTDREIAKILPDALAAFERQASILAGQDTASTTELLAGWPMRQNDLAADSKLWSSRLLRDHSVDGGHPPLPPALERALRQLVARQNFGNLLTVKKAAGRRRREWSRDYICRLEECGARVDAYLWHLGDADAAERCAQRALDCVSNSPRGTIRDGLLRTAIEIASGMSYGRVTRQLRNSVLMSEVQARAGTTQASMKAWLQDWNAHQEGLKADVLPEPVVEDDEITLLEAVQDDRDRGAWAFAKPEPQTRVVFGVMDHLPRVSQLARERGDTSRAVVANLEGVPLPLKRLEVDILQVAFDLHSSYPWIEAIIDDVVTDLAMAPAWLRLPRIIFAGPPGCGKTSLAMAFGKAFGIPTTVYSAAGVADGSFAGTSRQWSTGRICVPGQAIIQARIANPLIVVDEVEKSGTGRYNGNLTDTLLTLTEPTSSRVFHDPYLEAPIDLSAVNYLGTVNDPDRLPTPLRDRFRIVHVPSPSVEHVPAIVKRMVDEIRTERGIDPLFMPDLAPDEIEVLAHGWKPSSMRGLRGRVETMLKGRERLATRN